MKKLRFVSFIMLLSILTIGLASGNIDCTSSQYGQGKAAVQTNCMVSSTGFQLLGVLWWATFEDGMAMCCASVMDCNKTCDADNETVCHPV